MEFLLLVFFFVLFLSLAIFSNASARNQEYKRQQAARERLVAPVYLNAPAAPLAPVAAPRTVYAGPIRPIRYLDQMIGQAGLEFSPATVVAAMVALLVAGMTLASLWFGYLISTVVGLALAYVPLFVLNYLRARRLRMFSQQLPYVLDLLKSSLESGHSLIRALQMAAQNLAEPTASELQKVVEQVRVGMSLAIALEGMYRRVPVDELGFLAAATHVQSDIGSSLAEILEHVSQSIRTRQRLDAQVHTLTAQARASALIVALLPLVILGAFTLLKPDYARPLFVDPLGIRLLEAALAANAIAFIAMRHIARVDY